ncbi:hypothetical protein TrRE_jg4288 [Triparma retinervis]|uniref:phosphoglycerate mutase (2,3-diphosphoglycerate-dependent) n=1 Tax=Triparma retinervis TaxID=2557542 RepID=A0A9W7AL19_9STRA|nr:hypothetical protein TrRE_jg4288 [Triparma retinervis]
MNYFSSTSSHFSSISGEGNADNVIPKIQHSLNENTPYNLIFLRHGQSTWNRDNRFIGWTDTPLTSDGVLEARVAGSIMKSAGVQIDEVHTSMLRRSIRTVNLVLMELGQEYVPVHKHWRLNERNYGALVGRNKKEMSKLHGPDKLRSWRRGYDTPPPPMEEGHRFHPGKLKRYKALRDEIPPAESLKDTVARSSVYWDSSIAPSVKSGKTVLVVGHENNLRSLIMRLEGIDPGDIINLSLPRAVPLCYTLDGGMRPVNERGGGEKDGATGFLTGTWLGGDEQVGETLERDNKNVYDIGVEDNLELEGGEERREKWRRWQEGVVEGK